MSEGLCYVNHILSYFEIVFCRVYESIRLYQEVHNFFLYQTMEFLFCFCFSLRNVYPGLNVR